MASVGPDGLKYSPYGQPLLFADSGLANFNIADWLGSSGGLLSGVTINGIADPVPPPVVYVEDGVTYYKGQVLTATNVDAAIADRIAQRRIELGREPSTSEKNAIADAYRQLAGQRPKYYDVDSRGAADVSGPSFWEILSGTATGSAKQIGSGLQTVGNTVTNPLAIGGVGLAVAAIAVFVLLKR